MYPRDAYRCKIWTLVAFSAFVNFLLKSFLVSYLDLKLPQTTFNQERYQSFYLVDSLILTTTPKAPHKNAKYKAHKMQMLLSETKSQ